MYHYYGNGTTSAKLVKILLGKWGMLLNIVKVQAYFPCLWVPVTMAWRVLRLRMEERPPIWRVAANKLNKQSRTADKEDPPIWGLGEALTTPPREKQNVKKYS